MQEVTIYFIKEVRKLWFFRKTYLDSVEQIKSVDTGGSNRFSLKLHEDCKENLNAGS